MIIDNRNKNYDKIYIMNRIRDELENLNYNFNYLGTKYLIESIYLLYYLKRYYKFSLESDVYPIIANKYGELSNVIKSDIVNATDKMFYDCDLRILQNYLDDKYNHKENKDFKPGPKIIIRAVLKRIKDI